MEGLNVILDSADSVAHTVLGHHIESIQLWLWRTATEQHSSKISDLLLPNLVKKKRLLSSLFSGIRFFLLSGKIDLKKSR